MNGMDETGPTETGADENKRAGRVDSAYISTGSRGELKHGNRTDATRARSLVRSGARS